MATDRIGNALQPRDTRASWQLSHTVPSAARRSFFNRVITWLQLMAAPMAGQTLLSHNIKPSLWCGSPYSPPSLTHPPSLSLFYVPLRTRLWLRFNLQWTLFFARFLVVCGLKVFSAFFSPVRSHRERGWGGGKYLVVS